MLAGECGPWRKVNLEPEGRWCLDKLSKKFQVNRGSVQKGYVCNAPARMICGLVMLLRIQEVSQSDPRPVVIFTEPHDVFVLATESDFRLVVALRAQCYCCRIRWGVGCVMRPLIVWSGGVRYRIKARKSRNRIGAWRLAMAHAVPLKSYSSLAQILRLIVSMPRNTVRCILFFSFIQINDSKLHLQQTTLMSRFDSVKAPSDVPWSDVQTLYHPFRALTNTSLQADSQGRWLRYSIDLRI